MLIIRLADGSKIDPSKTELTEQALTSVTSQENPGKHDPITFIGERIPEYDGLVAVFDDEGVEYTMRIISESDKTLGVTTPRDKTGNKKKLKYNMQRCVIPDSVNLDGILYTVISIEKEAFNFHRSRCHYYGQKYCINDIILPETLLNIEDGAFYFQGYVNEIIIPENVKTIGKEAFKHCGDQNKTFKQIYIPKSVETIGEDAFLNVGKKQSPRDYYQGCLSSCPSFITLGNCNIYGIDQKAVSEYRSQNPR